MYLECPLTQFARGRTENRAMQGIHLGQQLDVFWGVAPNKGHGSSAPPILDGAILINCLIQRATCAREKPVTLRKY